MVSRCSIGVPAAYALARRDFPGKRLVLLLFLLPILMPPITYGIPLATVLYKFGLAGHARRRGRWRTWCRRCRS